MNCYVELSRDKIMTSILVFNMNSFEPYFSRAAVSMSDRTQKDWVGPKGAVIFKAGYRGGRIFGGVPNFLASFYMVSNILEKL